MRILLVDDNELFRRALARLLSSEPEWEVCGEAKDGSEALQKAIELVPDVVLLDISMPGIDGLQAARLLRRDVPHSKILVMSQCEVTQLLPSVLAAGGDGCVDKMRLHADLANCIRKISAGVPTITNRP